MMKLIFLLLVMIIYSPFTSFLALAKEASAIILEGDNCTLKFTPRSNSYYEVHAELKDGSDAYLDYTLNFAEFEKIFMDGKMFQLSKEGALIDPISKKGTDFYDIYRNEPLNSLGPYVCLRGCSAIADMKQIDDAKFYLLQINSYGSTVEKNYIAFDEKYKPLGIVAKASGKHKVCRF